MPRVGRLFANVADGLIAKRFARAGICCLYLQQYAHVWRFCLPEALSSA